MSESRDDRPRPQYGEYAPLPEAGDQVSAPSEDAAGQGTPASPPAAPSTGTPPAAGVAPSVGRIPGVPHNLGVSDDGSGQPRPYAQPQTPASPQQPSQTEHYRGTPPPGASVHQAPAQQPEQSTSPGEQGTPTLRPGRQVASNRLADRIITIVLLAFGAWAALSQSFTLMNASADFVLWGRVLGIDSFVVPENVKTLGTVGAIVVLAIYAVNLILSIQLMRRGKLAFYVPLAAGVLALIVSIAFMSVALSMAPELLQRLSDPDALQSLLDYLTSSVSG